MYFVLRSTIELQQSHKIDQRPKILSSHIRHIVTRFTFNIYIPIMSCFLHRDIPSLESLHKVFGWGLSGDGPYYRVQQGAAEQSEQSAEAAGPARDGGQPAADTVGRRAHVSTLLSLSSWFHCSTLCTLTYFIGPSGFYSMATRSVAYHCSFPPQTLCRTRPYDSLFNVNTLNWLDSCYYIYIYNNVISLDIVNWVLWFTHSQRKGTANVPFFIF